MFVMWYLLFVEEVVFIMRKVGYILKLKCLIIFINNGNVLIIILN